MNLLRLFISLVIMFFSLLAFFTLIEVKWKNRKKRRTKDTKGYRLLCPKCDTIVAEVLFPSETLVIHYNWFGEQRIKKIARKLGEGEYRVYCRKCGQELIFNADDLRERIKRWMEE